MSVIIRLQGLPWSASAMNIRHFFAGLNIPAGGVHIIGGEGGDAFIAFASDEDGRQAMKKNNCALSGNTVTLYLSSKSEMQSVIDAARQGGVPPVASATQPTSGVIVPTGVSDPAVMQSQIGNMGQQSTPVGNMPSSMGNMGQQQPAMGSMPPSMGNMGQLTSMGNMGQQQTLMGNMGQQPSSMGNMGQQPSSLGNMGQQQMSMYGNASHGAYQVDNQQGNINNMNAMSGGGDSMQQGGSGMQNPMPGYHNTDNGMQNQWQGYYGGHYSDNQHMQPGMNRGSCDTMGQYGNNSPANMSQYGNGNHMGMQGIGGQMGVDTGMNKGGNQNMMSQGMGNQNQGLIDNGMMQNKQNLGMTQQNMGNVQGMRNITGEDKLGAAPEKDAQGKNMDDANMQGMSRGMGPFPGRDMQGMGRDTSSMQGNDKYSRGMGFIQDREMQGMGRGMGSMEERDMQGMGRTMGSLQDREMQGMGRGMGFMHDREMQGMGRGMGSMQGMGTGIGSMQDRDMQGISKGVGSMQDGETQGMGRDMRFMQDREMQGMGVGSMQDRDMQGMARGMGPMQDREMQGMGRGMGDMQGMGRGMGKMQGMGSFSERDLHGAGRGFGSMQDRESQDLGRGMGSQERDMHGMNRGIGSQDREIQGFGKGMSSTPDKDMQGIVRGIGSQERGMGRGMGSQERDMQGMGRGFTSMPGRDGPGIGRGMGNMPDRDMQGFSSMGNRDIQGVDRRMPERDMPGMGRGMGDQSVAGGNHDGFGMPGRGWGQMDTRGPGDRGSFSERSSVMSGDHKENEDISKTISDSGSQGIDDKSSMRSNKWEQPARGDMMRPQGMGRDKWDDIDNVHSRYPGPDPMFVRRVQDDSLNRDRQGFERYPGGPMRGVKDPFNVHSSGSGTMMDKEEKNVPYAIDKNRQQAEKFGNLPPMDTKRTRPSRFSDAPAKPEEDNSIISTQYPPEDDMELESDGTSTPGIAAPGMAPGGLGKIDDIRGGNRPMFPLGRGGKPDEMQRGNQDAFSAGRGGMMSDRGVGREGMFPPRRGRPPFPHEDTPFDSPNRMPPGDSRRVPPLMDREWPERDSGYPPRFPRDERVLPNEGRGPIDKKVYGRDQEFAHSEGRLPMEDRKFPPEDRFRMEDRRFPGDIMDRRPRDGMPPFEEGRFDDRKEDMRQPARFDGDRDSRMDFRQGLGRGQTDRGFPPDRRFAGERGPFRGDFRDMESGPPHWEQDRFRNASHGDPNFQPQRNMGRGGRPAGFDEPKMGAEMRPEGPMDMDQRVGNRGPGQQAMGENTFDYGHGGPGRGRSQMDSVEQDFDSRFPGRGGPMDRGRGRGDQFPGRGRGFPPFGRGRGMDVDSRFEGMPDERFGEANNRISDKPAEQKTNTALKTGPGAGFATGPPPGSASGPSAQSASGPASGPIKVGPSQSKGLLGDKPSEEPPHKVPESKVENTEATKRDLDNRSTRKPESDRDNDRDRDRYSDRRDRDRDYGRSRDRYDNRDRERRRSRSRDRSRDRRYRSERSDTSRRESPRQSEAKTKCVIVKNMPTTISYKDVRKFFQPIEVPFDGLKVTNDDQGRRTGEAFVRFTRIDDANRALRRSGDKVDGRNVSVASCSDEDFNKAVDSFKPAEKKDTAPTKPAEASKGMANKETTPKGMASEGLAPKGTAPQGMTPKGTTSVVSSGANRVVELNNLPKNVMKQDISQFFGSSKIENNGQAIFIDHDESGSATGKGYVEFKTDVDYKRAMTLNNSKMGTENGTFVVKISVGKKEDALKVKSKASDMAQRANLRTMGAAAVLQALNQQQGASSQSAKMQESSKQKPGTQDSLTKPGQHPTMNSSNKMATSQEAVSGANGDSSLDTVCVHIQGLPLLATPQDIRGFFSDCVIAMRGVNIAHDGRGKPLGEGFVEFKFKQDFEKAIKKDKTSMGRHIVAVKPILKKVMIDRLESARQQGASQPLPRSDTDQLNTPVESQISKDQKQPLIGAQKGPGQTTQSPGQKQPVSGPQKGPGQTTPSPAVQKQPLSASPQKGPGQTTPSPAGQKQSLSGPQKGPGQMMQSPAGQNKPLLFTPTGANNTPKPLLSTNIQPPQLQQQQQQQQQQQKPPQGPDSGPTIQAGGSKSIPAGVLNKNLYYVRCQNFPPDIGIGEIIQFFVVEGFRPIGDSIRLHYSSEGKPTGNAVVGFGSGAEAQAALHRLNMRSCRRNMISLHPA